MQLVVTRKSRNADTNSLETYIAGQGQGESHGKRQNEKIRQCKEGGENKHTKILSIKWVKRVKKTNKKKKIALFI